MEEKLKKLFFVKVCLFPLFVLVFFSNGIIFNYGIAAILFALMMFTDCIEKWILRQKNVEVKSFKETVAGKLLITIAFILLLTAKEDLFGAVIGNTDSLYTVVVICICFIFTSNILISAFCEIAKKKGIQIKENALKTYKVFFESIAIFFLLFSGDFYGLFGGFLFWVGFFSLVLSAVYALLYGCAIAIGNKAVLENEKIFSLFVLILERISRFLRIEYKTLEGNEKKKVEINILEIILGSILVLYTLALIGMFVWGLLNSLKASLAFDIDCVGFPKDITFKNYADAFKGIAIKIKEGNAEYRVFFPEMFFNSLLYAIGCAFCSTLVPCLVAYVTAKYDVMFNKVVYGIVIFAMVTPIIGNLPSEMQMAKNLGLYDKFYGVWFMSATFLGTYYLVFYSTFKGLSWEYAEAALMDGANYWQILFQIMLPLVKNTFMVIFLLQFIARWNDYQTPWLYLPNSPTAAVGVQFFSSGGAIGLGGIPIRLAACMLLMVPVVTLFFIFRKKLVGNLTMGGIKG